MTQICCLFQEPIFIGGTPETPDLNVCVNGIVINTNSATETVGLLLASFLCFNLSHPKKQESVLEALEALVGL